MNIRPSAGRGTLAFAGAALAMFVTFRLLEVTIARLAQLPAAAYAEVFFLDNLFPRAWALVSSRIPLWLGLAGLSLLTLAAVVDHRRLGGAGRQRVIGLLGSWRQLDEGQALRWLVVAVTAIPAWTLSCYARNQYFDQLHLADRVLVVALWLAIAWRPLFVIPFALVAAAVSGQFFVPLGFITWTEMSVVLRFPVLFGAFWFVRAVTGRRQSDVFIFGWCCLLAVTYWTSGLGKLRIDWITHPHVHLLLLGAYANGWLAFLEPHVIERVSRVTASLVLPLMLFTLLVECGALVMLWTRRTLVGFLVLATVFHLGAFALTGIFFWKWILIEAMLLVYLLHGNRLARISIFTPGRFALSIVAVIGGPLWTPSENVTWLDTPLTYALELQAVDARGASHTLPAGFFRPYGDAIVLGAGGETSPHPKLTRAMGVTTDRSLAEALLAARTPESVFAIEQTRGPVAIDSAAAARFDDFVETHAATAGCSSERDPLVLRIGGVPRHLWTFPLDATLPCDVPLARVRMFERTVFFDGSALRLIRRRLLREVMVGSRLDTVRP
ncbi:MAG TPA: hypothetical protein VFZ21_04845 [Gemmatimonadaceae bacterium]|nr:hypothetical protein [Gemmatimonadaceae bacterium]